MCYNIDSDHDRPKEVAALTDEDNAPEVPQPITGDGLPPLLQQALQIAEANALVYMTAALQLMAQAHGSPEAAFTRMRQLLAEIEGGYIVGMAELEIEQGDEGE